MATLNPRDLVDFAEKVFGEELTDGQKKILRAGARSRRVAIKGANGTGKTRVLAILAILFAALYEDVRVLILSPGWLTVRAVIWAEIHSLLQRARYRLPATTLNQTEIRLGPRNLILGLSTNDAVRLQGHHAEHVLVIIDEAPGIEPSFWPAIEGVLAGGDAHIVMAGNPTVPTGPFYDAFTRNRTSWNTLTMSAFDSPNLAGVTLERLLGMSDAELDDNMHPLTTRRWVRERYPEWFNGSVENSPLWAARVLGEFPRESINALIPLAALEAARRPAADPSGNVVDIGIDVAGPGRDRTVALAVAGGAIIDVEIWTDADPRGRILEFLRRWLSRLRAVRIDSAGIGYPIMLQLRDHHFPVEGINVAAAATDKERFANVKAERFWSLRDSFVKGEVSGLTDEMLAELVVINYGIDGSGRTIIEAKSAARSELGRSPDLADAVMLALGNPGDAYVPGSLARELGEIHRLARARRGPSLAEQLRRWF
jgi:phage terminase large subunit